MINADARTRRYAPAMRDVSRHPRSRRIREQGAPDQMKRLADVVIACALLAITSPLMMIVALAIKWESPGPVLDRQSCIGRGGRRFQMLKFRTFVHDPEHAMPVWLRAPTQIGHFLRYTRIEALPQLINMLRGEMSMIDRDGHSPSFLD
jgi:lipopolysaccharide/colanic/teichoic acid biosynthesis glycosyltransferase